MTFHLGFQAIFQHAKAAIHEQNRLHDIRFAIAAEHLIIFQFLRMQTNVLSDIVTEALFRKP